MALALEGFSIREYAGNMRSVDFDKCWPFEGGGGGGRSLPQISVRKFRFWSDKIPEEGKAEEIPLIRTTPSKGKQRTPKKRSIVELFAVAPPIEAIEAEDDDDSVEEEDEGMKGKDVMEEDGDSAAKRKGKGKVIKEGVKKGKIKKIINRKKKKLKVEICATKKEKIKKLTSSAHIFHKLQGSKHKLLSGKNSKNPVDSGKKPAYIKNLPKNRKSKLLQSSKRISKKKREPGKVLQVHSILKNPIRGTSKKSGRKTSTQGGNLVNLCCESEKRASSAKDDILGHSKSCSPIDIPQLRSLCKIFSDVLAASSALDNTMKGNNLPAAAGVAQEENAGDINVSRNTIERTEGTSSEMEQSSQSHSDLMHPLYTHPGNKSCSDTERASFSITVDQHHSIQSNDVHGLIPQTSILLASDRHLDSVQSEGLNSHSDIQVKEVSLKTSDAQFLTNPLGRGASRSDATGSQSFIRDPSPPHSISCSVMSMEENGRQPQPPVQPVVSCWQITEIHPMHHLPSKDSTESMHSSVGSRLVPHPVPTFKDKCIGEGFVGLPLNSQGELIHLQSGAKFGLSDIGKRENAIQGSIHSYQVPYNAAPRTSVDHVNIKKGKFPGAKLSQKDRSDWFQEHCFHVNQPAISGNSFANLQSIERFGVYSNNETTDESQIFLHDHTPREVSCHGCMEDNRTRNYIDRVNLQAERNMDHVSQPNIQQTMRLMGTNVTVGRNNQGCQSYDDGRIWTDKEVVTDNRPSVRVSDRPLPQQWLQQQWVTCQSTGMPKNNLFHPLDASSNFYHMPAIAPRLGITHFDYRPQWISRNRTSSTTGNQGLKVDLFSHPLNSQSLLNEASHSIVTSIPGITSVKMGHQIPMAVSNPHNAYQHTLLNSTHCKHSQGIAYSTTSTFHSPFLYHKTRSSIQPSPTQSSPNLPQWLLKAKQQKKIQDSSCSCYSGPVASHHHSSLARTDVFPLPLPHPTSRFCLPVSTATTSQRGGSSTPSIVQSPFISACTSSISRTAVDSSSRNKNMSREGTNFNFTYLKSLDSSGRSRKRPAAKDDRFMKPAKKPFLRMQDDSSASAGAGQGEQMHRNTLNAKKTTGVNNSEIVNEKEGLRTLSLSSSLKVDGGSRSGPIKLSAGAKHVLKPSQDLDLDKSRPTHSTIPFSIGNTSGKVMDPQMKAAEIYRF